MIRRTRERPARLTGVAARRSALPLFFFSSRRRHTRSLRDWRSDVCSSDLAVKLALIAVTLGMAVAGLPLPFSPVQIVVLELFMDLGASVAFVNLPPEGDEMRRRPRDPGARILDRRMLAGIAGGGLTL